MPVTALSEFQIGITSGRIIGRVTGGSGTPEELTGTQTTGLLDTVTTTTKGLAPASGGGTANFLRADLTWAAPAGGGSPALTDITGVPTASVLYRKTAGTGNAESQTLATLKTDLGLTGTNSGDQTTITGNAGSATVLQTARTINGVSFNGSTNITINAVDSTARLASSAVSAFGLTLIDDADAATARATLGAQVAGSYATGGGTATGTNTGDETKATIDTKIGATGGTTFYRKDGTWAAASGGSGVDFAALPAASAVVDANEFLINEAGTQKKVTGSQIEAYISTGIAGNSGAAGQRQTTMCLAADSADVTSTTQTTVMTITGVGAGTWRLKGTLIYQTAATTTGIGITLNHTGTVSRFVSNWIQLTTGGAAATGVGDQATSVAAGQLVEGKAERVKDTRSSFNVGVDTANADQLVVMDAIVIVTATGQLELKIATEIAASAVRLMAGSLLELSKVA